MWVQPRPVLPLSVRRRNPLGSFGQSLSPFRSWRREPKTCQAGLVKIVSCCPCKFTHCSLLSPSGGERSAHKVAEVAAARGHVSTWGPQGWQLQQPGWGRRGGVPGGCLPPRQEPQPLLAGQEAGVSRLAKKRSPLPRGTGPGSERWKEARWVSWVEGQGAEGQCCA